MLQELFLALSGHSSPIFTSSRPTTHLQQLSLSPAEASLVASFSSLSKLHIELKERATRVSKRHGSAICRAVSSSVLSIHLAAYKAHVLAVEQEILTGDAGSVSVHGIVPLSSIAAKIDPWKRPLAWLLDIMDFVETSVKSGVSLLNRLLEEAQTGFPDIAKMATELVIVAETAWLKQLSTWVLYGRLPEKGQLDFFIGLDRDGFATNMELLPLYVSATTASSILFIGRSLNLIQSRKDSSKLLATEQALRSRHLSELAAIPLPLTSAAVSTSIASIRLSLSQNVLQELLPMPKIQQTLKILRDFFLLNHGYFASVLVSESQKYLQNRQSSDARLLRPGESGIFLKDGELATILSRTWAVVIVMGDEGAVDEDLEKAKDLITLSTASTESSPGPVSTKAAFDDLLFAVPARLSLRLAPPLDLFLDASDISIYSRVNSYLLALRQGHDQLNSLWQVTSLRRQHPSPYGPPLSNSTIGQRTLTAKRKRDNERQIAMRKVWARCEMSSTFISELVGYFHGSILQGSWEQIESWLNAGNNMIHDPETVSLVHRRYIQSMCEALFLNDDAFVEILRSFLLSIKVLVTNVTTLSRVQQSLDLEQDEGVIDSTRDFVQEEIKTQHEISRVCADLGKQTTGLLKRLETMDLERSSTVKAELPSELPIGALTLEPRAEAGIDRLLMKLDFENIRP